MYSISTREVTLQLHCPTHLNPQELHHQSNEDVSHLLAIDTEGSDGEQWTGLWSSLFFSKKEGRDE
jgi:hypothetical protein